MNEKDRIFVKRGFEVATAVAFPMGNIVFLTHLANAQTPYCPTHSKPMAAAIRLLLAYTRSGAGNRTCSEKWQKKTCLPFGQRSSFCGKENRSEKSFLPIC
jgi:hypothetical protein